MTGDFDAAKLLGLRKVFPEQYRRIGKITSVSEWIAQIFTGRTVIEPSQACETQLMISGNESGRKKSANATGSTRGFFPISARPARRIRSCWNTRKLLGLSDDAVFVIGGADTQIALRQAEIGVGDIAVVSGTGACMSRIPRPAVSGSPIFPERLN